MRWEPNHQVWPLDEPGKCMTTLTNMGSRESLPADPQVPINGFGNLLDIFATEDFKILPKMQANFEALDIDVLLGILLILDGLFCNKFFIRT